MIEERDLRARHDFDRTLAAVTTAVDGATSGGGVELLRFLGRFVSWNGGFGSGVATLAGKIGRARHLFLDPNERIAAAADRSVHVASYFFDAARDEFDDRATPHRDTHRTLAQAVIKGIVAHHHLEDAAVDEALDEPLWLTGLHDRTRLGYGLGTPDDLPSIFRSMGFHLGSEVLADQEFTQIDQSLRAKAPALVDTLLRTKVHIADQDHAAYYWVGIHSGLGGSVEHDHFEWAVQGVREAFRYTAKRHHEYLREQVLVGFEDFARCHTEFFRLCNRP
jgi:hypothetical protein